MDRETMAIKTGKATPRVTRARKLERSFASHPLNLSDDFDKIVATPLSKDDGRFPQTINSFSLK
jgi:hypothetical protein